MSTLGWLLIYDILMIAGIIGIVWSAKSLKRQFAGTAQNATSVIKLFGTCAIFTASCILALYVSGVMTLASTR